MTSSATTTIGERVASPMARYARLIHATLGPTHHVASPAGAWLLLALCSRGASGERASRLADLLGMEPEAAAEIAATLLDSPHPSIHAAAALWLDPDFAGKLSEFLDDLPIAVARGPVPTQSDADAWASRKSDGLIEHFPLVLDDGTSLVAATALATRVSWEHPFELAPGTELGRESEWSRLLKRALRTPPGDHGHVQFITATAIGDVAVHAATAREGVTVLSVLAAPDLAHADVIGTAYELARRMSCLDRIEQRSLFDLPVGDGPLGTIREHRVPAGSPSERVWAILPPWVVNSEHDLSGPGFGFSEAAAHLAELAGGRLESAQAAQGAVASYTRYGFEAAAVTAMAMTGAPIASRAWESQYVTQRVAELRFGRPFAVVAVGSRGDAWRGVPLFSAWVANPDRYADEGDDPLTDTLFDGLAPVARPAPIPVPGSRPAEPALTQFLNSKFSVVFKAFGFGFALASVVTLGAMFSEHRVGWLELVGRLATSLMFGIVFATFATVYVMVIALIDRLLPRRPPRRRSPPRRPPSGRYDNLT